MCTILWEIYGIKRHPSSDHRSSICWNQLKGRSCLWKDYSVGTKETKWNSSVPGKRTLKIKAAEVHAGIATQ